MTLSATSEVGDGTFMGWSGGGCSGTGTCSVTMDQAKTVTAEFESPYGFEVSVDPTGTGSAGSPARRPGSTARRRASAGSTPARR